MEEDVKTDIIKMHTSEKGDAKYFSISGFGEGYVYQQFKVFLEKFTQEEAEKIFGEGAKQLLIGSMFDESFKTRLVIPIELVNNLDSEKKEHFANFLRPLFERREPNKRNKSFIDDIQGTCHANFSCETSLKDKNSLEVEYELRFYQTVFGRNDPTSRLHKVINDLLGENLVGSKVEYKRIDYTPYILVISDTVMDAIHNSPNYEKIVNALKNPAEVCRGHRKGDFVGRLRNAVEIGKEGTWSDKFLTKKGVIGRSLFEIS